VGVLVAGQGEKIEKISCQNKPTTTTPPKQAHNHGSKIYMKENIDERVVGAEAHAFGINSTTNRWYISDMLNKKNNQNERQE
jgi:hypothetical protein